MKSLVESSEVFTSSQVGVTRDSSGKLFSQTVILKKLRDDVFSRYNLELNFSNNRFVSQEQVEPQISRIARHHRLGSSEGPQLLKEMRENITESCKRVRADKLGRTVAIIIYI